MNKKVIILILIFLLGISLYKSYNDQNTIIIEGMDNNKGSSEAIENANEKLRKIMNKGEDNYKYFISLLPNNLKDSDKIKYSKFKSLIKKMNKEDNKINDAIKVTIDTSIKMCKQMKYRENLEGNPSKTTKNKTFQSHMNEVIFIQGIVVRNLTDFKFLRDEFDIDILKLIRDIDNENILGLNSLDNFSNNMIEGNENIDDSIEKIADKHEKLKDELTTLEDEIKIIFPTASDTNFKESDKISFNEFCEILEDLYSNNKQDIATKIKSYISKKTELELVYNKFLILNLNNTNSDYAKNTDTFKYFLKSYLRGGFNSFIVPGIAHHYFYLMFYIINEMRDTVSSLNIIHSINEKDSSILNFEDDISDEDIIGSSVSNTTNTIGSMGKNLVSFF